MEKPKFSNETILSLLQTLVGEIRPIGETNHDNQSFENLQQLCSLADDIVFQIEQVAATYKDRYEFSIKRSGEFADNFIKRLREHENSN